MSERQKLGIVLVLTMLICKTIFCEGEKTPPTVMGLQFGAQMSSVRSRVESFRLQRIDERLNMLAYRGSLVSIDIPEKTYTYYLVTKQPYTQKQLNKVITYFDTTTLDNTATELISRFRKLKELLTLKYGSPSSEKEFVNPVFDNEDLRLMGFKSKNAEFICAWEPGDLHIQLQLYGELQPGRKFGGLTGYTKEELIKLMKEKKEKVAMGEVVFILSYEYLPLQEKVDETKELDSL